MYGLFGGFKNRDKEAELARLEKKLGSARLLGKTECLRCGFCCHRKPCVPTPDEIPKIAEYLHLSVQDFISKYMLVDRMPADSSYYLRPVGAMTRDLAGKFLPADRSFHDGPCIFLQKSDDGYLCQIHPVKPESAKNGDCWNIWMEQHGLDFLHAWEHDELKKIFGLDGDALEQEGED